MTRVLSLALVLVGCHHAPPAEQGAPRAAVAPVWSFTPDADLRMPDTTCRSGDVCIHGDNHTSKYRRRLNECDGRLAPCGHVRTVEFIARHDDLPARDRMGRVRELHEVSKGMFAATISFSPPNTPKWANHTSSMLVEAGDVIPTPRGRARVVAVVPPTKLHVTDDADVVLRFLEPFAEYKPNLVFVSSGAASEIAGQKITLIRAQGGVAEIAYANVGVAFDSGRRVRGDVVHGGRGGQYPVIEVVDGRVPGPRGWITVDLTEDKDVIPYNMLSTGI